MAENKAFQLTGAGAAAIAVVRITGPDVARFLTARFSGAPAAGKCVHGELRDGADVLDDPVIVLLPDGSADINLHGGAFVVRSVLDLLAREGFIVSKWDTSVLEAVDGATILEKEVNAHLPLAQTELAVRVLGNQVAAWEQFVSRNLPSIGEADHLARWLTRAQAFKSAIAAIPADRALWWLLHPPRVAIIGAPNVGKSTLANQLFARRRVITADMPGTTRDWVGEIANIDGLAVMLVDTPGIRSTDDAIEAEAIARSGDEIAQADLVIVVLDATRPLDGEQAAVLETWPSALRVVNKTDTVPAWDINLANGIQTVATAGNGIDEVRRAILAHFGVDAIDESRPRSRTERQHKILEESVARVEWIRRIIDDR